MTLEERPSSGKSLPIRTPDGKTLEGKQEVPGQGWFALFRDMTGAVDAVWENSPVALQQQAQGRP